MNPTALASILVGDQSDLALRQAYEAVLHRAMGYAERLLPRDQAFEISHDIAVAMLRRPKESVTPVLVYVAVTNRARRLWRNAQLRGATDAAYLEMQAGAMPSWADPGSDLEAQELSDRLEKTIAAMPSGMREVFLLVRDEGLSYKDAAARLKVGVGTVHTQLSRANVLLRDCVQRYRTGNADGSQSTRRNPSK